MTTEKFVQYFLNIINVNKTFDLDNWLDTSGYPKLYEGGVIKSTLPLKKGVLPQSLFIAGKRNLFMGIMDYDDAHDHDVDLNYDFQTQVLTINFTDITTHNDAYAEDENMNDYTLNVKLFDDDGEFFQENTVTDLPFEFEVQKKMKVFFDAMYDGFCNKKVLIK